MIHAASPKTLGHSSTSQPVDKTYGPSELHAIMGPPKQIACYSATPTGVEFNTASLRYFVTPQLGVDLHNGYYSFMRRYMYTMHQPQRLDNVLFACLQSGAMDYLSRANVVVRRGVLVKLMLGNSQSRIDLNVSLIDGVLYIEERQTKPRLEYHHGNYPGYSFETLCTNSSPLDFESDLRTHVKSAVGSNVQWLSTIQRNLGDLSIIMAGEVDCIKGQYTGQPDTFLELKSKKIIKDGKPSKVASWYKRSYLQCYLLGVPELFIGYHSNGILRSTEALFISDIPSKIVNQGQPWNPQVELDRGYAVLTTIRESCAEHLAQRSNTDGMSNDKVWHVKVRNKETKVQELTMQEARNLTSADDLEQRIGIVPTRVVEELRRIGQVTS